MPNEIIKQRIFWLSKLKIHNSESLSSQFFVAMSHNLMTKDCIKLLIEYLFILQYDEFRITNVFHLANFWIISNELRFIFHLIMMKHSQCVVFTFLSIIMKQKRILIKYFQSCFYSLKDNLRCLDKYKMSSFNYLSSLSLSLSLCFLCLAYILSANS